MKNDKHLETSWPETYFCYLCWVDWSLLKYRGYFYAHTIKDIKDYLMFSILKYRILYLIS